MTDEQLHVVSMVRQYEGLRSTEDSPMMVQTGFVCLLQGNHMIVRRLFAVRVPSDDLDMAYRSNHTSSGVFPNSMRKT